MLGIILSLFRRRPAPAVAPAYRRPCLAAVLNGAPMTPPLTDAQRALRQQLGLRTGAAPILARESMDEMMERINNGEGSPFRVVEPVPDLLAARVVELEHRLRGSHKLEQEYKDLRCAYDQLAERLAVPVVPPSIERLEIQRLEDLLRVEKEHTEVLSNRLESFERLWFGHFPSGPTPEEHLRAWLRSEAPYLLADGPLTYRAKDWAALINDWCPALRTVEEVVPILNAKHVAGLLEGLGDAVPGVVVTATNARKGAVFTLAVSGLPI